MNGTVSLLACAPLPRGKEQYGREFIRANRVLKLQEDESRVTVGAVDGDTCELQRILRDFHRKPITVKTLDSAEFSAWLGRLMGSGDDGSAGSGNSGYKDKLDLEALASDAPVINLVNSICIEAIRRQASDIHLEAFADTTIVRYRIDGVLRVHQTLPAERFSGIASRIKVMAGLNLMERRRPQDGRLTVNMAGSNVDIRVSCVPTAAGAGAESIVLRIFNADDSAFSLTDLGLPEDCLAGIAELLKNPHGMVLVTGPTGSGKTTSLNAMLRSINSEGIKIVTIEDPVEYLIDGVDQIQTDERIGLGFSTLLRRVLRQDPDVILVGEIRDSETAELAVRAALTGHLVLSSLHTNDAVSAVSRLINLGVEAYLIAAVLRGVIAQRLTRRLCPACRRSRPLGDFYTELYHRAGLTSPIEEFYASGCPDCDNQGYRGRIAAAEFFIVDRKAAGIIASAGTSAALDHHLREQGMIGLRQRGLTLAAEGLSSFEELRRAGVL